MQNLFLFFQVFQDVGFQVRARSDIHDLEDRGECVVVLQCLLCGDQIAQPLEQLLQAQIGSDTFIEWVFVQDHAVRFQVANIIARTSGP